MREESANAFDLMRVNSEFVSNEINESELHDEKHEGQRIEHDEEL
jgi:hypothetical protein